MTGTAAADIHADRILILDFGSQYTQLIARRVRELGVYCEIHPWDAGEADVRAFGAKGIILSGGPESVTVAGSPAAPAAVFELGVPVLGICYGMQTMAAQLGGRVEPGAVHEFGYAEIRARGHSALLQGIEDRVNEQGHGLLDVWMSHGDRVVELPPGFKVISSTPDLPIGGMADETRRFYALQFHPEVTHTRQGAQIYARFLHDICGCAASWNPGNIIDDAIARVRAQVGQGRVLLGLSGGVDSSVVAALLLILPGFLTSALGLILLIPVVQRAVIALVGQRLAARGFRFDANPPQDEVVEGEFTVVVEPRDDARVVRGHARRGLSARA